MRQNNIYRGIPLAILAGDGALKAWAKRHLSDKKKRTLFGGRIRLRLLENPGAALGALQKKPRLLLAGHGLLLGTAIGRLYALLPQKGHHAEKLGLALLIGGGGSNLLDRVFQGTVTDYFSIDMGERFQRLGRIVFNLSDVCVFLGMILHLISKSMPWPFKKRAASASQAASKL